MWWIERRLIEERERACDEAVLLGGAEPHDYAEAILLVCRHYVASPSMAATGVTGANLKRRIEDIVNNRRARPMARWMVATVSGLAACTIVGPVALGAATAARPGAAQAASVSPVAFQAASIKPNASVQGDRAAGFQPGGRFIARNMALRNLIAIAYGDPAPLPLIRIVGGPGWVDSDRFDIEAKADSNFAEAAAQPGFSSSGELMLRTLLSERFKLAAHLESREIPVYALMPARRDKQLAAGVVSSTGADCATPQAASSANLPPCGLLFVPDPDSNVRHYRARDVTMDQLARSFSGFIGTGIDRSIVNRTGMDGGFSFDLRFSPPAPGGSPEIGISIFTAFQEQLGLRLDAVRAPVNVVVVDHVERLQDGSAQLMPPAAPSPAPRVVRPQQSLHRPPSPAPQAAPRPAAAQSAQTGAIAGSVTDFSTNDPLEDVLVEVSTEDPPDKPLTTKTDASGAFSVDGLAPGTYIVTLHHEEYQTFKREGLRVEKGQTATMAVAMRFSPIRD